MDMQQRITESARALVAVFGDTNATLAAALGQSEASAAGKRTGRLKWTLKDVEALAAHYDVTVDQVLAGPRAWLGLPDGRGDVDTRQYHPDDLSALAA
jgi:hypothetical protein